MIRQAIIIFTRIPVPGKVKTRLAGTFSNSECSAIQQAMLHDLFNKLEPLVTDGRDIFVCYSDEKEPTDFLKKVPSKFKHFSQEGVTIGERMNSAFQTLFACGYQQVVLIGSDIPELTLSVVKGALNLLENHDVVIGPSLDGGYYLIGAKKQDLHYLFLEANFPWGSGSVFQQTLSKLAEQKKSVAQTKPLIDIDYHQDLTRYTKTKLPNNKFLNKWLGRKRASFS